MNTIGNSKIRDLRDDGSSLGFIEGAELHAKNWLWPRIQSLYRNVSQSP
jgi:hypothetical protein